MHPTIDLNFVELPEYTVLAALGALVGLASAYLFLRQYSRRVYSLALLLDAALLVLGSGWVGGRAYHLALNWGYYSARPDAIWDWQTGGLGMRGAFIAGAGALAIFARLRRVSFWRLADAAGLGLAIGQVLGWAGAYTWGSNYGAPNDSLVAMELPDVYGIVEPRFPLQLAEIALFGLLFLGLVWLASRHPRAGMVFAVSWLVASTVNFALGFLRGDETAFLGRLSVDQIVDLGSALAALIAVAWRRGSNVGNVG